MDFMVLAELVADRPDTLLVKEMFGTRREADSFADSLCGEGGVLDGFTDGAVTVTVQEMCNGVWTVAGRRLVRP